METKIFSFDIKIDWKSIRLISDIDRFDAQWSAIEQREGQSLRQLRTIATIRSVGASNRIEGNKMTDEEIDLLLQAIDISKLEDRDSQEVVGYFDTLDMIADNYNNIDVTTSNIKSLHKMLMKHSKNDEWHRGNYKTLSNAVEATLPDGTKQVIFRTTEAGVDTEIAMQRVIEWYNAESEVHALIKIATFVYEFLSIHPFQDGNGRLSRLLSTLLLLQHNYKWVQYISFEHEIESRKSEYYRVLRACQAQRPGEDITVWVEFFLNALKNIQQQLMSKLELSGIESQLSPREKSILLLIQNYPGIQSGEIAAKLNIPNPSVKRHLADLKDKGLITQHGAGRGINYSAS